MRSLVFVACLLSAGCSLDPYLTCGDPCAGSAAGPAGDAATFEDAFAGPEGGADAGALAIGEAGADGGASDAAPDASDGGGWDGGTCLGEQATCTSGSECCSGACVSSSDGGGDAGTKRCASD
jgi:hypothetical protein